MIIISIFLMLGLITLYLTSKQSSVVFNPDEWFVGIQYANMVDEEGQDAGVMIRVGIIVTFTFLF